MLSDADPDRVRGAIADLRPVVMAATHRVAPIGVRAYSRGSMVLPLERSLDVSSRRTASDARPA